MSSPPSWSGRSKVSSLRDAISAHVRAGDAVHVMTGHTRWTAAAREWAKQWWGREDGQFTLIMLSLSSLGTLFFRGGLVKHVVTGYSGDVFPNFTPNPIFAEAYRSGRVTVEHWSFLAYLQRLEAAARGLPAMVTRSLQGSSMEDNEAFATAKTPFGDVGLLAPLHPDVALLHGAFADREGNVAFNAPLLEGAWGALAARRGAIVTVEKIVDDIRPWSHLVRIPAHRVLAVVEAPLGAHPGGFYCGPDPAATGLPVTGYAEDYDYWTEVREATRAEDFDAWVRHWILEPSDHGDYIARLGDDKVARLRDRARPDSWVDDQVAYPPDLTAPTNAWEAATVFGARWLCDRIVLTDAHAALAGAGVANLAAWLGVEMARARGAACVLTAELGLWGYEPTLADPMVFNHRSFPSATMVSDTATVLGMLVGGEGTRTLAALGCAQVDRFGNLNSTLIPGGPFLVGSGGGNDVASVCHEALVVTTLTERRTPASCGFITSPGRRVRAVCTDLGILAKSADDFGRDDAELELVAVPDGPGSFSERIDAARAACGWDLRVASSVAELPAPTAEEVARLRGWDPRGFFLRG